MESQYWKLLDQLSEKEYRTSAFIAQRLGLSDKTVRVRLKEMREILMEHGADLISKQRMGFRIEIIDRTAYEAFCRTQNSTATNHLPTTSEERVYFILSYLLSHEAYIRIEDLGDMLYVSKNTLAGDIRQVEAKLSAYHILIHRRPNYGIRAEGTEFDRRLCITNLLVRQGVDFSGNVYTERDQAVIGECLISAFRESGVQIEELSFQSLVYHPYTALRRVQQGYVMPEPTASEENISYSKKEQARQMARKILKTLEEKTGVSFPSTEIQYLAIHLAEKRAILGEDGSVDNLVIPPYLSDLAEKILDSTYQVFQIDLRENLELKLAIATHMVPLEIRIKYHLELRNPILEEIKRNYAFPFTVARQAVLPLLAYYNTRLSDDEIGYFAVLFALEMERGKQIRKKNILLVCASGKGSAELIRYRYQKEFGSYLNRLQICRLQELPHIDFLDIDYVCS